jgi:hypothetical protein
MKRMLRPILKYNVKSIRQNEYINEGTFSIGQLLSSTDFVYKVEPSEVWRIPKGRVPLGFLFGVIGILLEF